jgi:hypothetical protein
MSIRIRYLSCDGSKFESVGSARGDRLPSLLVPPVGARLIIGKYDMTVESLEYSISVHKGWLFDSEELSIIVWCRHY